MENLFGIGDIVYPKESLTNSLTKHYYIISEITEDVCHLVQIFPVTSELVERSTFDDNLNLLASVGTNDYEKVMTYIDRLRAEKGKKASLPATAKPDNRKTATKSSVTKSPTFSEKDFNRMMRSKKSQKSVEALVDKMNTHLDLLHKALQEGNEKAIEFQKKQLDEVRQSLMELEYFSLEKRRDGVSLRVK